jgi:hypothetical protein
LAPLQQALDEGVVQGLPSARAAIRYAASARASALRRAQSFLLCR